MEDEPYVTPQAVADAWDWLHEDRRNRLELAPYLPAHRVTKRIPTPEHWPEAFCYFDSQCPALTHVDVKFGLTKARSRDRMLRVAGTARNQWIVMHWHPEMNVWVRTFTLPGKVTAWTCGPREYPVGDVYHEQNRADAYAKWRAKLDAITYEVTITV